MPVKVKLFDLDHPFFHPLWVRILVTLVTLVWSGFEFATGAPFWGVIALGAAGLCYWSFFIDFDPDRHERTRTDADKDGQD